MSELVVVEFHAARLSEYGREFGMWLAERDEWSENDLRRLRGVPLVEGGDRRFKRVRGGMASFSDYLENAVLDHVFNDPALAAPSVSLALTTVVPTDSSTGATITEANYTGYARKAVAAADMSAASGGSKTNVNALTYAACTSGSSTIIGYAGCDSGTTGAGNSLFWGTAASTVISTTQTPATIAVGGLVVNLD